MLPKKTFFPPAALTPLLGGRGEEKGERWRDLPGRSLASPAFQMGVTIPEGVGARL